MTEQDSAMSVQEIKELMEAFQRNRLGKFRLQQGDFSLELEDQRVEQVFSADSPAAVFTTALQREPAAQQEAAEPPHSGTPVISPIVGTFYAAPAPDKDPYVQVGSRVKKGDVLFIIESMKLMNEVTSELDGVVTEIVVENAQGVEYGQPILYVQA